MQIARLPGGSYKVITLKGHVVHMPATLKKGSGEIDTSGVIEDIARGMDEQLGASRHVIAVDEQGACIIEREGIPRIDSVWRFLGVDP